MDIAAGNATPPLTSAAAAAAAAVGVSHFQPPYQSAAAQAAPAPVGSTDGGDGSVLEACGSVGQPYGQNSQGTSLQQTLGGSRFTKADTTLLRRQVVDKYEELVEAGIKRLQKDTAGALAQNLAAAQRDMDEYLVLSRNRPHQPIATPNASGLRKGSKVIVTYSKECGGRKVESPAFVMPKVTPPPKYLHWSVLPRNEIAADSGRRMFFSDDTGETTPVVEETAELQKPLKPWLGGYGRQVDDALRGVGAEFGCGVEVVAALSQHLDSSEELMCEHLQAVCATIERTAPAKAVTVEVEVEMLGEIFCRRCFTYACRTHEGNQMKPHLRRAWGEVYDNAPAPFIPCKRTSATPTAATAATAAAAFIAADTAGNTAHAAASRSAGIEPMLSPATDPAGQQGSIGGDLVVLAGGPPAGGTVTTSAFLNQAAATAAAATANTLPAAADITGVADAMAAAAAEKVPEGPSQLSFTAAAPGGAPRNITDQSSAGHALPVHDSGSNSGGISTLAVRSASLDAPGPLGFAAAASTGGHAADACGQNCWRLAAANNPALHNPSHNNLAGGMPAMLLKTASNPRDADLAGSAPALQPPTAAVAMDLTEGSSASRIANTTALLAGASLQPSGQAPGQNPTPLPGHDSLNQHGGAMEVDSEGTGATTAPLGGATYHAARNGGGSKQLTAGPSTAAASGGGSRPPVSKSRSKSKSKSGFRGASSSGGGAALQTENSSAAVDADMADSRPAAAVVELGTEEWTPLERAMLRKGLQIYGPDACNIAALIGSRPCQEVASCLTKIGEPLTAAGASAEMAPETNQIARRKPTNPKRKSHRSITANRRHQLSKANKLWPAYSPCTCVGSCMATTCTCILSGNFCEKFCGCAASCSNRFKGCSCTSRCRDKKCPCFAAHRECDPDLCRNCTGTAAGTEENPAAECCNMHIRLGKITVPLHMGISDVQGWGLFSSAPVPAGTFLGEYTGDLIGQSEADRRGSIYDKINQSYLFGVNASWVLDARHRGNVLRFANHSETPTCAARLMMVDGEHRVSIWTSTDIKAGLELFYDYNYEKQLAIKWAKAAAQRKAVD